jgi:uncharacterized protein (UPF0332 family)
MSKEQLTPEASEKRALVFLSRLNKAERMHLLRASDAFPELSLRDNLSQRVEALATARLLLAEGCLEAAEFVLSRAAGTDCEEHLLRTAVTKAYYSIHHSLRTIALLENGWEFDGHKEVIDEVVDLWKADKNRFRSVSGLPEESLDNLYEARNNRSVADYSPFEFSRRESTDEHGDESERPESGTIRWTNITGDNWRHAAEFNVKLAKENLIAADKVWKERIARCHT